MASKGVRAVHNEAAAIYVSEYLQKEWLKKIGYVFNPTDLDVITAEAFVTIGTEFQAIASKERDGGQRTDRTRSRR